MRPALLTGWSVSTAALVAMMGRMIGRELGPDDLEPTNAALLEHAQSVTGMHLHATAQLWVTVARSLGIWWADGHDLLLTPVVRTVTPRLGDVVAAPTTHLMDGWPSGTGSRSLRCGTTSVTRRCRCPATATTAYPSEYSSSLRRVVRTNSCRSPPNSSKRSRGTTTDHLRAP